MAAPTPSPNTIDWDGTVGTLRWRAAWTDGTNFAASKVVDISTLGAPAPNSIKISYVCGSITGGMSLTLLYDATTDETIDTFTGSASYTTPFARDYRLGPSNGVIVDDTTAAGFTGDLLLTTTGATNTTAIDLLVVFEASS